MVGLIFKKEKEKKRVKLVFLSLLLMIAVFAYPTANTNLCTTICEYNGCTVFLHQAENSYRLFVRYNDGWTVAEIGSGQFGGTLCGGVQPCIPAQQ
jgi:hypothetical protein